MLPLLVIRNRPAGQAVCGLPSAQLTDLLLGNNALDLLSVALDPVTGSSVGLDGQASGDRINVSFLREIAPLWFLQVVKNIIIDRVIVSHSRSFFWSRKVNALIQEFWWALGQPAYATFAFCVRKGWIKQLAYLLDGQIFNLNGIAQGGAKGIDAGAQAKLYKSTNGVGADRVMSFRPGIDLRGKSFGHFNSADGIAAGANHIFGLLFGRVCHVSIPRPTS
jgi:hypothetical protein